MPDLKLWSEKELDRIRRNMDRLLEGFYGDFGLPPVSGRSGDVDIQDAGEALLVRVHLPQGISARDIELTVFEDGLRLSVSKLDSRPGRSSRTSMTRSLSLPCSVDPDTAQAQLAKGILAVRLPKCARCRRKTLPISES